MTKPQKQDKIRELTIQSVIAEHMISTSLDYTFRLLIDRAGDVITDQIDRLQLFLIQPVKTLDYRRTTQHRAMSKLSAA